MKYSNPRVEKGEVVRNEVRELPQTQSNFLCPSLSKDTCTGTNVTNIGGIQASNIGSNQKIG